MSYGKVHDAYWESERIETLSDRAALLGLFLISGPHRNAIGCFKLGMGAITDNPRFGKWGIEGVSKALQELIAIGFIARDERTGWTFIRNALKHDPIKGWKTAASAVKLAAAVPTHLSFYKELSEKLSPMIEGERDGHSIAGYPLQAPSDPKPCPIEAPSIPLRSPIPEPIPAPQPAARRDDFDPRYADTIKGCETALGEKAANCLVWGRVNAWLKSGADPERDTYPTLKARKDRWRGSNLEFFDGAIADAIASRTKPMPAGNAPRATAVEINPLEYEENQWCGRLTVAVTTQRWNPQWGPQQHIPKHVREKFPDLIASLPKPKEAA